jgi:hypothetical protein
MKKHSQKRGPRAKPIRAPERALSRIIEGKEWHPRHGKRGSR